MFILSKLLYFLVSPGWWILILLMIAYRKRRSGYARKLCLTALLLFLLFSNEFIYRNCLYAWQVNETDMKPNTKYTGILLGGMVHFDKDEHMNFNASADRYIQTLNLYRENKLKSIIITGGSASILRPHLNEAVALKKEFLMNNIPDSIIFAEGKSRNTLENAKYTRHLIDSLHIQGPFVVITSAWHIRRARKLFEHEGISAVYYPSAFEVRDDPFSFDDIIPGFDILGNWGRFMKEIVGLAVYKVTRKI